MFFEPVYGEGLIYAERSDRRAFRDCRQLGGHLVRGRVGPAPIVVLLVDAVRVDLGPGGLEAPVRLVRKPRLPEIPDTPRPEIELSSDRHGGGAHLVRPHPARPRW